MTNLILKKIDTKELQLLIDCEMAAYAIRLTGFDLDYTAEPNARGDYPRKMFQGAIEAVVERSLALAMAELQKRLDAGYAIFQGHHPAHESSLHSTTFYVVKPEALQVEDTKKIAEEVTAKYHADINAHNEKVYVQEAVALKAEELAIAAQIKAEDEALAAQEFDKRVQARMRGSKTK